MNQVNTIMMKMDTFCVKNNATWHLWLTSSPLK